MFRWGKFKESPQVPFRKSISDLACSTLRLFVLRYGVWGVGEGEGGHCLAFNLTLEKISESNASSWILVTVTDISRGFYGLQRHFHIYIPV